MKLHLVTAAVWTLWALGTANAQDRIYRCGNEYTNQVSEARAKDCKLISGGSVTIVQGTKPAGAASGASKASASATSPANAPKVDTASQKARDADARLILESELKKAKDRHAELLKEYNNGEPERLGPETRNNQKYLDRVASLKDAIARNEEDMASIQRELNRLP
ncbi:hypothetical protein KIK84_01775 [Curvibacter sp. CHRR-16]|uniref:hypothetical protein n=1 Tax=Curvibacter sp. CHRR-16 TaxID=2835872 RepID=UPI001BDB4DAC|nr:hypothetical protein [Curvibacter sp. CHRR-16]MBT0569045.1 hypothetical protein [Curvibacter sp. CHRR-16]